MSSLAKNYKRRNLSFNKGKGSFLYTKRGIKFLDFVQGIAVNSLGHANSNLVKAIKELKDENDALKARVEALES